MVWGRTPKAPAPPRSAISKLIPLVILFLVIGGFAFVGYQIYLITQKVSAATSEKMEKKHVVLTKDGLKVGVKELKNENYVDTTQSFLVKAWNLSSWPGYKSRLGWGADTEVNKKGNKAESRKPYSRSSSSN